MNNISSNTPLLQHSSSYNESILHQTKLGKIAKYLGIHKTISKEKNEKILRSENCFNKFRKKIGFIIESRNIQIFLIFLIFLDIGALIAEIVVESHFQENQHIHDIEEFLRWSSISILIIFAIEQILLIFSFDLDYFKHPMYIIDLIIVLASLILELIFKDYFVGFLALFRLWRVLRITHGIVIALEDSHKRNQIFLIHQLKQLKDQIQKGNIDEAIQFLDKIQNFFTK
jgi:hypothetical protein